MFSLFGFEALASVGFFFADTSISGEVDRSLSSLALRVGVKSACCQLFGFGELAISITMAGRKPTARLQRYMVLPRRHVERSPHA